MTLVKICGITREEDAAFAESAGAHFLGVVFVPESPRFVTLDRAKALAGAKGNARLVGVFRNAGIPAIREAIDRVPLDYVQLHGEESDDEIADIPLPVIRSIPVGKVPLDLTRAPRADWLLFDTFDRDRGGGTGRPFDWSLIPSGIRARPFFLAGGITPLNAAEAIRLVRPDAIDVSSGVESSPGIKDHDAIRNLMEAIRR